MNVLISGAALISQYGSEFYMTRTNALSLRQWLEAFGTDNCTLLLPFKKVDTLPKNLDQVDKAWNIKKLLDHEKPAAARRKQAAKCLQNMNPKEFSVVYCRMPSTEAWWTYQFAKRNKIAIISELHGNWKEAFLAQPSSNWLRMIIKTFRANWADRAFRQISSDSIGVACIGPKLRDCYVPSSVPSLVTTNHTVPAERYVEREDFSLNEPAKLIFIGELQKRKGLHVLFDALKIVKNNGHSFRLDIFGNGAEEENLRRQATMLEISDSVDFRGYVSNGEELFKSIQNADAFVMPSIAAEGVPRANHEAMAMGCPVIATDIGSTDWQIREGGGLLVRPKDATDLAEKISMLLGSPELRQKLSQNGLRNAKRHSYELQAAEIATFVKEVTETLRK